MPQTENAPLRLPPELRRPRSARQLSEVKALLRRSRLVTVCEEARCPNIGECFSRKTATFMILGDTCTRRCHFCNVKTGRPGEPDVDEPRALAEAAASLGLDHVVITSVDRDELEDCGADHWAACIRAVKDRLPSAEVEILTPDFKGRPELIDRVLAAGPSVFNHNIETVSRLYRKVRPQSRWETTCEVLRYVATSGHPAVKSGLMVGLGETDDEVLETLRTLRELGVHIVTIGQYMRPTLRHWEVDRYVDEARYERYREYGEELGFTHVFAGPFVRSSYHAKEAAFAHRSHDAAHKGSARRLTVLS
ncbi:MAG: lipoyl synthase [Myxococcota bacterium]